MPGHARGNRDLPQASALCTQAAHEWALGDIASCNLSKIIRLAPSLAMARRIWRLSAREVPQSVWDEAMERAGVRSFRDHSDQDEGSANKRCTSPLPWLLPLSLRHAFLQ
jgi:hypothetical protein